MIKQSGAVSVALLLLCSLPLLAQTKVPPKAIRFQGAPQYTQQELEGKQQREQIRFWPAQWSLPGAATKDRRLHVQP
jgi:hypothetical protein